MAGTGCSAASSGSQIRAARRVPSAMVIHSVSMVRTLRGNSVTTRIGAFNPTGATRSPVGGKSPPDDPPSNGVAGEAGHGHSGVHPHARRDGGASLTCARLAGRPPPGGRGGEDLRAQVERRGREEPVFGVAGRRVRDRVQDAVDVEGEEWPRHPPRGYASERAAASSSRKQSSSSLELSSRPFRAIWSWRPKASSSDSGPSSSARVNETYSRPDRSPTMWKRREARPP